MKIESRTIIAVLVTVVILVGGFLYMKGTAQERAYKAEIRKLKMISEHQALEIVLAKQKKEMQSLQQPVTTLTPATPLEKK